MVLLGGLEVLAAGYLIRERNKFRRERARVEAEDDLRARGFKPENMEEHAKIRNEEILLHRRQTGLLGPPLEAGPVARPLSAPGLVQHDQHAQPTPPPPPNQHHGWHGWHPQQHPQHPQGAGWFPSPSPPQPQFHQPGGYGQPHPQGWSPGPAQSPFPQPVHPQTMPQMPMYPQQMSPPPPYASPVSVPVSQRGYGPPVGAETPEYPREKEGYREHKKRRH